LCGDGELIIFFWQAFAVLFDNAPDGNTPQQGRGNSETFNHGIAPWLDGHKKAPVSELTEARDVFKAMIYS
jgi:hypothetical protein